MGDGGPREARDAAQDGRPPDPRRPATVDHTFIVPAYGESPFLRHCLRTLQAQTIASHILVTTSTPSLPLAGIAREFGLDVIVNPRHQSIGADWNFALDQAKTRFVTLAHQDDAYHPQFRARTRDLFARCPGATLTCTGYEEIGDDGKVRNSRIWLVKTLLVAAFAGRREVVSGRRGRLLLSFGNPLSCSSVTFDRDRLAGLRFSETLASNLDWHAWLTLIERGDRLAITRDRLVQRRYNDATATSRLIADGRRQAEDLLMFEHLWPRPVARLLARLYAMGYG